SDGLSPDGQSREWLPDVDVTAKPALSMRAWETCRLPPICKGSVDLCPPGPALARNWRRASFACHPPVYQGGTGRRGAARRARAFPDLGTPASQPDARLLVRAGVRHPAPSGQIMAGLPSAFVVSGVRLRPIIPRRARSGTAGSIATAERTTAP